VEQFMFKDVECQIEEHGQNSYKENLSSRKDGCFRSKPAGITIVQPPL